MRTFDLESIAAKARSSQGNEKEKFEFALLKVYECLQEAIRSGLTDFEFRGNLRGISQDSIIIYHQGPNIKSNPRVEVFCNDLSGIPGSNDSFLYNFTYDMDNAALEFKEKRRPYCSCKPTNKGTRPSQEIDHKALEEIRAGKGIDGNGIEKID